MSDQPDRCDWRAFALALVDACGARAGRAQRRARVFEIVLWLRRVRFRVIDTLSPVRRRAVRDRERLHTQLAVLCDAPAAAEAAGLYDARGDGQADIRLDNLRVGIFIPSFLRGQGGAEKVAGQLADVAVHAGATVSLFCRPPDDRSQPYALDPAVHIRFVNELDDREVAALRDEHLDLLVCFGMAHFYRRIPHVARLLEVPYVVQECTNPEFITRQLRKLSDARTTVEASVLRQAMLAHAAAIRVTSPRYLETISRPVRPFTYAFYNAFRLPEDWRRSAAPERQRKVICVGGLKDANKNGLTALRGFCAFARRHPSWYLVFYGENNYAAEVAKIVRAHPGVDVRDAGVVRDITAIYGDACALLIPSYEEGLPNVVVEAFSFGVPCIGFSDCAAVAHLVRPRETGILVERADPRGIEHALEAIADPAIQRPLAEGARAFAAVHFDFANWAANWLKLLRNAAERRDNQGLQRSPAADAGGAPHAAAWRDLLATYRPVA